MKGDRYNLLAGAAGLALAGFPLPGQAQAPAQAPMESAAEGNSGEILVTAQRRQERLRDVPLTVTQITGDQLQSRNIISSTELSRVTPGLRIDNIGSNIQPSIRGINATFTTSGTEPPVATYIDGIYQLSLAGLAFDLPDVRNVEVLKGPQGTLFGRNATGGAIQVFTLDPEFTFGGKVLASYGNYNDVAINAFVTGPISDKVAVSVAGSVHNNDGYIRNIVTGDDAGHLKSHLIRGKILFEPTNNFKVTLIGFYVSKDSSSTALEPLNGVTITRNQPGAIIPQRPYEYAGNVDPLTDTKNYGGSLHAELSTDIGTLSTLTGWSKWHENVMADGDWSFVPGQIGVISNPNQYERGLSQEINFASRKFGDLSFVAGLFYYDGYGKLDPQTTRADFPPGTANVAVYSKQSIKAGAVYGELRYEITDRLTVIGGLRYSSEKRRLNGVVIPFGTLPSGSLPTLGKRHDTAYTPRASVIYKLSDQSNLYFTYNKGFKSGGYNTSGFPPVQTVAPERVTAYEVGSKSRFGPLDLNVSAYYYNYDNKQVSASFFSNGRVLSTFQNAAKARIYGLDVEAGLTLAERLRLSLGVSLLNATYLSFPAATISTPRPDKAGDITSFVDVGGNYLNRSPKATVNLTADYTVKLTGGDLRLTPSVYYSSRYFFEPGNRIQQPRYVLLDARIAYAPVDTQLVFSVYGKNLTNKVILGGGNPSALSDAVQYQPPRTYGVSVGYKF